MNESINNEGSETVPMTPQGTPTEPQAQVAPEYAPVEAAPVASAVPQAFEPEPVTPAHKSVTISHRALWITSGVVLGLILLLMSFGFGVAVGRHSGAEFGRARGGMMLQAPNQGGEYGQRQDGRAPYGWRDGGENDGYGDQNGSQGWHGGQGFRGMPRGQLPTGTPSP